MIDTRGVGRQVGPLGYDVDSGKQGDGLIHHQIHDMALALGANQFHGQETADSLGSRNHLRTRQVSRGDDRIEMDAIQ